MKGFGKEVRDRLREGGCEFVRHGTARAITTFGEAQKPASPSPCLSRSMSRHLANKILKDAGLPKAF
jgi:hypothetical protein